MGLRYEFGRGIGILAPGKFVEGYARYVSTGALGDC